MNRRDMIAFAGFALAGAPRIALAALPVPVPPHGRLAFSVMRKGRQLGSHLVSFEESGDRLVVRIAVDLALSFGPITLYRYHHRGSEQWQGGHIEAIDSQTNDDGTHYQVMGRRGADGFAVEGTRASRYIAPPEALPANHWNRAMLGGPFINTQDGRLMHPRVASLGPDIIPTAAGNQLRANHFQLTGDVRLDTWYDASPCWVGLSFTASDGSLVRYERQDG